MKNIKLIYQKDEDGLPLYQHTFDLISSIKKYNWWNKTNIEYTTDESSFQEGDIFSGSVEYCFQKLKEYYNIEETYSLTNQMIYMNEKFFERKLILGNINSFDKLIKEHNEGIFVKPLNMTKLFNGSFIENERQFNLLVDSNIESSVPFLYSTHIDILSEYRLWIHKNEILSVKLYLGDTLNDNNYFLDKKLVMECIQDFSNITYNKTPELYTLDFAVLKNGKTSLIEINDIFGTGTYGFDNMNFFENYYKRFKQVIDGKY
jgi:hypothetical protein